LEIDYKYWPSLEDRVEYGTNNLLELLARHNIWATFFVLGCVAVKHPDLIKRISKAGHEIGSHGTWHGLVYKQTREEFRQDLVDSKRVLEDITGKVVEIYRAPSWSISASTLWALQVLEEEGFKCDSSIQPFKTPLSGMTGTPVMPFYPIIDGKKLNLLEFPPTVLMVGKLLLPFAGGIYLRLLPLWLSTLALAQVNRQGPGMVYVHPWETDLGQPRQKIPSLYGKAHYFNLGKTKPKLESLFQNFKFVPIGELIKQDGFPSVPILAKPTE
jgi:polysaccharide deacetylase family protein (PEP-CTERM system associated)